MPRFHLIDFVVQNAAEGPNEVRALVLDLLAMLPGKPSPQHPAQDLFCVDLFSGKRSVEAGFSQTLSWNVNSATGIPTCASVRALRPKRIEI